MQQLYNTYLILYTDSITSRSLTVSFSYAASNRRELKDNPDIIFDGFCCQFFISGLLSIQFTLLGISWSIDSLSVKVWMINDERIFGTSENDLLTAIEPKAEST